MYQNPAHDPNCKLSESELTSYFETFYEDVFCELVKYGNLLEMHVCDNVGDHLIGNVYARYDWEDEAQIAVDAFNQRWYAGQSSPLLSLSLLLLFIKKLFAHLKKKKNKKKCIYTQVGLSSLNYRQSPISGKRAVDRTTWANATGAGSATSCQLCSLHPSPSSSNLKNEMKLIKLEATFRHLKEPRSSLVRELHAQQRVERKLNPSARDQERAKEMAEFSGAGTNHHHNHNSIDESSRRREHRDRDEDDDDHADQDHDDEIEEDEQNRHHRSSSRL
jgi:hypothetical protein